MSMWLYLEDRGGMEREVEIPDSVMLDIYLLKQQEYDKEDIIHQLQERGDLKAFCHDAATVSMLADRYREILNNDDCWYNAAEAVVSDWIAKKRKQEPTKSTALAPEDLENLWEIFGDIPINDDDQIEEDFLGFEKGTNRFDVWHWFDERYPGGVIKLAEEV